MSTHKGRREFKESTDEKQNASKATNSNSDSDEVD